MSGFIFLKDRRETNKGGVIVSAIARRLTGLTKNQLREYEFLGVYSKDEVFRPRTVSIRQNVRFAAGLFVGIKDLNSKRRKLAKSTPKSLRS